MTAFIKRVAAQFNFGPTTSSTIPASVVADRQGSILLAVAYGNVSGETLTTVSDSAGNTYVKDYSVPTGSTGNRALEVWRCQDPKALTSSSTISVTASVSADQGISMIADLFSRLGPPSVTNFTYHSTSVTSYAVALTPVVGDALLFTTCAPNGQTNGFSVATTSGSVTAPAPAVLPSFAVCYNQQSAYEDSPGTSALTTTYTTSLGRPGVVLGVTYPLAPLPQNTGAFFSFMGW